MSQLSLSSIFRLVAVAAVGLGIANWWPGTLPSHRSGSITSVTWCNGLWGLRTYSKVIGSDRYGCTFEIAIDGLPSYSKMKGAYPDGSLREESAVYVTGSVDGARFDRRNVEFGNYFSPNGTQIGQVANGTGNIIYCWPDGTPSLEYELQAGELIRERQWWKNGTLRSDTPYRVGRSHGESLGYYPNGQLRSKATMGYGSCREVTWYDQTGTETTEPDSLRPFLKLL